jgi:hypothetical protein
MFGILEVLWVLGMMTFGVLGTAFWIWMLMEMYVQLRLNTRANVPTLTI